MKYPLVLSAPFKRGFGPLWARPVTGHANGRLAFGPFIGRNEVFETRAELDVGTVVQVGRKCYYNRAMSESYYMVVTSAGAQIIERDAVTRALDASSGPAVDLELEGSLAQDVAASVQAGLFARLAKPAKPVPTKPAPTKPVPTKPAKPVPAKPVPANPIDDDIL